jgi:multidrug efflux pump subunit AcrA (membrane-fusion protein)
VLAALLFIKVPLRALAPAEIIARDPFVVAAPIDGVIEAIPVEPNQRVEAGVVLVKLAGTALRNRFEVADREVQVAEARLKQSNQIAFSDSRGMHEIGIARAELSLKLAERDFARDLLAKTEIIAPLEGLAIYSDRRELIGQPVAVGERILEIADPARLEARIDLPVADAIALTAGASVTLFLDSDPLRPWPATVRRADYKAKVGENEIVSFRVVASLTPQADRALPRLGVRGTAQLSGDNVSLGLFLFRRPITYVRQWLGL